MYGVIYKYTNKVNHMIYIGQHKCTSIDRFSRKPNNGTPRFYNALKKYGKGAFTRFFLECADSLEELNQKEKHYIKVYNTHSEFGYNLTDGGDGVPGCIASTETKAKQRAAALGEKNHNFGTHQSVETRTKHSETSKGVPKSAETRARMRKPKSDKHRENIRISKLGDKNPNFDRRQSPNIQAKRSASLKRTYTIKFLLGCM